MDFLEFIGQIGGIAGVFAVVMFLIYRQDKKDMESRMRDVIKDYNSVCNKHIDTMVKHTQVLTELITWLKHKNGN